MADSPPVLWARAIQDSNCEWHAPRYHPAAFGPCRAYIMASLQIDVGESARKRIAVRLLPFLFLLYITNYLDRTNIAYATLGMKG